MKKINEVLANEENNYIMPFFWQHGENEETLRDYMKHINKAGIKAVCIEARPHPDFLGPLWWRDMDIIMEEAKNDGMKVWLLDDSHFPTGYAAGKIKEDYPQLKKWYLNSSRTDFSGPLKDSSVIIKHFAGRASMRPGYEGSQDKILGVIAAKISNVESSAIDAETLIDVSSFVHEGILYWDIPEGNWSIFVIFQTRNGGEEITKDYLNPIVPEGTKVLIDVVYESHFERYKDDFGKTFAGFFSDEPRFGNIKGFDASIGRTKMVLPWREDMLQIIKDEICEDILVYLPLLFAEGGEKTASIRYAYMDTVSKLYGKHFTTQLGDWCREHGVEYIGHVIEDNGAHSRLGYGAGHFFRALEGQDMSGIDVIGGQIVPGMDFKHSGFTQAGWDGEFFHYGLAKLGSSLGHIDPKKKGRTMCEIFGAYGWVEGLKLMKWLTDHMLVRGVNNFVPHAFSPKAFPDYDCPPHFYAGGNDPQFRYMKIWSTYTNRISHLLSGGTHIAPVAVLYHAEAEWSGEYMPFQKPVKELLQNQIDCDVIPADIFKEDLIIEGGNLIINNESFRCLVVPYSQALPKYLLSKILQIIEKGLKVIFINELPDRASEDCDVEELIANIREKNNCEILELNKLAERIKILGYNEIALDSFEPYLTYYHYKQDDADIFMFFNEHPYDSINTNLYIPLKNNVMYYDAFKNEIKTCKIKSRNEGVEIPLKLNAYESKIIIFNNEDLGSYTNDYIEDLKEIKRVNISGSFKVAMVEAKAYPNFTNEIEIKELVNLAKPNLYPHFSGTIKYEKNFEVEKTSERAILDLGAVYEIAEIWLNNKNLAVKICPPYKFDISGYLQQGSNHLVVEVTNTLVKAQPDSFSQFAIQEPTGLIGPVSIIFMQDNN